MRQSRHVCIFVLAGAVSTVLGADIGTLNGKSYKNATVMRTDMSCITISYASGIATIPFTNLPAELREKYGYDPVKEAQFTAEKNRAARNAEIRKRAQVEMEEGQPSLGMVGSLHHLNVIQVVGDNEVLVQRRWYTSETVMKSINGSNERGSVYSSSRPVTHSCLLGIQGLPTAGLVDGAPFSPSVPLKITGTKSYPLPNGATKTVFVAQPLTFEE